ncbi:MAG: chloride channel protein [Muribaculaceae bacterium]|nr:chloride channel protein [Muribaculaceae bacterium]
MAANSFRPALRQRIRNLVTRYLRWQNANMSESVVLILIALIIGILTGCAAAVLKRLVKMLNEALLWGVSSEGLEWRLLVLPLAGVLITSIFQRYVVRGSVAQGTKIIRDTIASGSGRLSLLTAFNSVIGCSLTMGFGASGGTEGPTALAGSALASNVGRFFRLPPVWSKLLVAIGGGAGIAAIFKSPMGGVLFTLEVLQMHLTTLSVIALIIACLFASSTAYLLSDFSFDIEFWRQMPMEPSTLGWVALLGVFCGFYSIYYNYTKARCQKYFMAIRNPWIGALSTGLVLSVCIFLFPALFGEGFGVLESLVNGTEYRFARSGILSLFSGSWVIFAAVGALLLLKGILVAASYSNGGVAGDFVPTFYAGAMAGFLFGLLLNQCFGVEISEWYCALIGMGCVMAGTIHAPLMAIFILCETTNTYGYIFPYLIAIFISYAIVEIFTPKSWRGDASHDDIESLLKDNPKLGLKSRI